MTVQSFGFGQIMNAQMNPPYAALNAPRASTAKIGLHSGTVIFQNAFNSDAPSMLAASYNSRGKLSKNPFSRKIENPFASPGSTNAQYVLSSPSSLMSRKLGINETSAG